MPFDDLLYALGEWIRTTPVVDFALWLSKQPLSSTLNSHFFVIPVLQTLHILAIAAAFGSVLMVNLRILGLTGADQSVARAARRYLPWIWSALAVMVASGLGLVIGEPVRELTNPIFWVKMGLVAGLVLVSLLFQASAVRRLAGSGETAEGNVMVRAGAIGLIAFWCLVIFAGRWIAYAPA